MKRCLRKVIGRLKLTYDELLTAATEVELILNSRPLTFVSSNDKEEPLTSSHLIVGRRLSNLPDELCYHIEEEFTNEVSPLLLIYRLRYHHNVMDKFWSRWRNEYLLNLRERYPTGHKKSSQKIIKIGNIVVVHSDELPHSLWRLGRVMEVITGTDGNVRCGVVEVLSGEKRFMLIPLEIDEDSSGNNSTTLDETLDVSSDNQESTVNESTANEITVNSPTDSQQDDSTAVNDSNTQSLPKGRLRRAAAIEARDKIYARMCED
uniref:DUF5641 domain-containing protein n=1 Tax=Amphimedon queenslandica TaxID=400682 RepID=A0A1X7UFW8_AMPQE